MNFKIDYIVLFGALYPPAVVRLCCLPGLHKFNVNPCAPMSAICMIVLCLIIYDMNNLAMLHLLRPNLRANRFALFFAKFGRKEKMIIHSFIHFCQ